jgi:hypothetical protein
MPNDKAGQPNRTAPPVTLRNADESLQQRNDSKRSRQHVNEIQEHLLFDVCIDTQLAVHAVTNPQNYQGTWNVLVYLAGFINGATGETFVSAQSLAKRIGVDRGITRQQLQRLQDSGIVTKLGKQRGRSDIRSIVLPCKHLDIDAGSPAEIPADTHAGLPAEIPAEIPADTSPHYQNKTGTEQDQQQVDVVAGYSLAERQAILSAINDWLPKAKRITLTKALHDLFDSWHDNSMPSDEIIAQLHKEQASWDTAGGIVKALEIITDAYAAKWRERQPVPVINPCTGLAADVECDTMTHTKLGSNDPVLQCPQRKAAS